MNYSTNESNNCLDFESICFDEWVNGSGVLPEIFNENVEIVSGSELFVILYPNAKRTNTGALTAQYRRLYNACENSQGWAISGINPVKNWEQETEWARVKPDPESEILKKYDEKPKYLNPTGVEPQIILIKPPTEVQANVAEKYGLELDDENFWRWVSKHPEIPLIITEGEKKAGCALSQDEAAIGIPGIWMGEVKISEDERILHPFLEYFNQSERVIYLVPDYDKKPKTKHNVRQAFKRLGSHFKGVIKVCLLPPEGDKLGLDDWIVAGGGSMDELKNKAINLSDWEAQLENDSGKPNIVDLGIEYAHEVGHRLKYSLKHKEWMSYGLKKHGVWEAIEKERIEPTIHSWCLAKGVKPKASDVTEILNQCRFVNTADWDELDGSRFIPFLDGVLDIESREFAAHSEGNHLTWALPREYQSEANSKDWETIKNFLFYATGYTDVHVESLLCFASAVLRGITEYQKFLFLVGQGGTGKSTYCQLLSMLVGEENLTSPTLQHLEQHLDAVSQLMTSRILLASDEIPVSRVQSLKKLTGQDYIEGRGLFRDRVRFIFPGLIVITANENIFHKIRSGGWLKRRCIRVEFNQKPEKRVNLKALFEAEIASFTNFLLSIPKNVVGEVLSRTTDELDSDAWKILLNSSLHQWIEDELIHDVTASTQVGCDKNQIGESEESYYQRVDNQSASLFGAYYYYCRTRGYQAQMTHKNFKEQLLSVLNDILGWNVEWRKTRKGSTLFGVRLRNRNDDSAIISEKLPKAKNCNGHPWFSQFWSDG